MVADTFQSWPQCIPSHVLSLLCDLDTPSVEWWRLCCLLLNLCSPSVTFEAGSWKSMHFCPVFLEFISQALRKPTLAHTERSYGKTMLRVQANCLAEVLTRSAKYMRIPLWHQSPAAESPPVSKSFQLRPQTSWSKQATVLYLVQVPDCEHNTMVVLCH